MNDRRIPIGRIVLPGVALLLLASCSRFQQENIQSTRLPVCTAAGSPFASMPVAQWPDYYHGTVSRVVEAHLDRLDGIASVPLDCTAAETHAVEEATAELRNLAAALPAWKAAAADVRESDLAPVLLELLRVYECSLNERRDSRRWILIPREQTGALNPMEKGQLVRAEDRLVERELTIAKPSLERTLLIIGGMDRLRPLSYGTECLKRTSLDLRNVLGLAAEASACLPRAWDARGSLRDLFD